MIVHDVEQNGDSWFQLRLGIPTASEFSTIMAKSPGGKAPGKSRQTYMRKLAGERIRGEATESYTNSHMDRGHDQEAEARELYAFKHNADPVLVGFVTDDDRTRGASPDAFIGDDGCLEIKTRNPWLLIEEIERDRPPPEHIAQCQGQLWVAERQWLDLVLYCPRLPLVSYRIERDEAYIANLAEEVARFNEELAALVERVRRYGGMA